MALPILNSHEGKQRLATRLYRDFHAMKTYGKEPESLDYIIELFNETLAEYSWKEINNAMTEHTKKSAEFPTPSDVVSLIREARKEQEKRANAITYGIDDTIEKLTEYQNKQKAGERLSYKESKLLRDYGWKLDARKA